MTELKRYYEVYDNYEGDYELIGVAENIKDVKSIMEERYDDTDGECYLIVVDELGKDVRVEW